MKGETQRMVAEYLGKEYESEEEEDDESEEEDEDDEALAAMRLDNQGKERYAKFHFILFS